MVSRDNDDKSSYDLIVLGSGPAGQRAAVQAAKLKKRALLVENREVGGACLHRGTIPSKTLREAALLSKIAPDRLSAVMTKKNEVIQGEMKVIQEQLRRNGVDLITGVGSFLSETEIQVKTASETKTFKGRYIVIATGTYPARPPEIAFNDTTIFDSDTIIDIPKLPKSLLVLGAGVIGCEYASIFANLGVEVTLLERRSSLLRSVDTEIVSALEKHFRENHIDLILSAKFDSIQVSPKNKNRVECNVNGEKREFDALLYCMGRNGNALDLNLKAAKIEADERGIIKVNKKYQTNVPAVFAVGDIIGPPALAASSSEQGRLAACHAFCVEVGEFPATFPYGIYTIPEISSVGLQESEVQASNIPYVSGKALYKELARGKILGDEHGLLKILVDKRTRKLLGIHVIGTGATELVHIGQVVMALGAPVEFLVNNVFNYPTLAEAYKVAALHAYNQLRQ